MTNAIDVEKVLREALHRIAPDIDIDQIDRGGDLREAFDIDSMDFLNLVTALAERLGRDIPEADYARLMSYDSMLAYLEGDH